MRGGNSVLRYLYWDKGYLDDYVGSTMPAIAETHQCILCDKPFRIEDLYVLDMPGDSMACAECYASVKYLPVKLLESVKDMQR